MIGWLSLGKGRMELGLQEVGDDLLSVAFGLEGDMDPVVEAVGGLEDELVEAAVVGYPGEPLTVSSMSER